MGLFGDIKFGNLVSIEKLGEAVKGAKDVVISATKDATEAIKKSTEKNKELKAPLEGALARYSVIYLGGLPKYPKARSGEIGLNIMNDCFYLKSTAVAIEWFEDMLIPYSAVKKVDIVKRRITKAEMLLGSTGSSTASLEQENNIHITFDDAEGNEFILRLEMLTGVSVYGQAGKCREMMELLRQNGILKLLTIEDKQNTTASQGHDIIEQIEKLSKLKESGILTEEEFNTKKASLLERL